METKICNKCGQDKPLSGYYYHNKATGILRNDCKKCTVAKGVAWQKTEKGREARKRINRSPEYLQKRKQTMRANHYSKKYGITPADYDVMLVKQGGTCACCSATPGSRRFHVDHCHTSGAVRGLLCYHCNVGLGMARDNTDTLRRMIDYLNVKR